jgi:hypothetical protein
MTDEKTSIADDDTAGGQRDNKPSRSFVSDERRLLDALEDDEVKEVLRGFQRIAGTPPA